MAILLPFSVFGIWDHTPCETVRLFADLIGAHISLNLGVLENKIIRPLSLDILCTYLRYLT